MVSPIYPGGTYPVGTTPYGKKSESEPARTSGQHYDQVQFSSHLSEAEKRVRETAGQITRQIRTRPSRQELEALRQQVSSGTYQVDAKEIAARMLLMEEH
ncbi:flagellar biosynthesis anti-sigma factor FlgM [Dysosmobacter sp.]|uniref:flagellar biosynthesis anti-sigma factor FlgM n=1 Tax=Dysosmobacter sp. TaxID=2591382 RepID=UPI0026309493|nr:flagellar biosynthesis anti-sigma factor FlgM [Dysosmobacter sp.]